MIKLISCNCPECGAHLKYEEGRKSMFCSFCGANIILHNENEYEYVYKTIDVAKIKEAETKRYVLEKQIQIAEKSKVRNSIKRKSALVILSVGIILAIVGAIVLYITNEGEDSPLFIIPTVGGGMIVLSMYMLVFSATSNDSDVDLENFGKIEAPDIIENDYQKYDYRTAENIFRQAGFINIMCKPTEEKLRWRRAGDTKNLVEKIYINGKDIDVDHDWWYEPDSKVLILYCNY